MIQDIKVGDKIYVITERGKFLRTIGWVGNTKVEWKWGWANIQQLELNPDKKSRVKFIVKQEIY